MISFFQRMLFEIAIGKHFQHILSYKNTHIIHSASLFHIRIFLDLFDVQLRYLKRFMQEKFILLKRPHGQIQRNLT